MKCPFENCAADTHLHEQPSAHLMVTIDPYGHPHYHGPVEADAENWDHDKKWVMAMIVAIARATGISLRDLALEVEEIERNEADKPATLQ